MTGRRQSHVPVRRDPYLVPMITLAAAALLLVTAVGAVVLVREVLAVAP